MKNANRKPTYLALAAALSLGLPGTGVFAADTGAPGASGANTVPASPSPSPATPEPNGAVTTPSLNGPASVNSDASPAARSVAMKKRHRKHHDHSPNTATPTGSPAPYGSSTNPSVTPGAPNAGSPAAPNTPASVNPQ